MHFFEIYTSFVVPCTTLLALIVYILKQKVIKKHLQAIGWYLCFSLFVIIISALLASNGINNLWLFHIDTIGETAILLFYFRPVLAVVKIKRYEFLIGIIFLGVLAYISLFIDTLLKLNAVARSVESILFILISVYAFFQFSKAKEIAFWSRSADNWVVAGILLYFSSSFCFFLFSNFLLQAAITKKAEWVFDCLLLMHASFIIIMNCFFVIGFNQKKISG